MTREYSDHLKLQYLTYSEPNLKHVVHLLKFAQLIHPLLNATTSDVSRELNAARDMYGGSGVEQVAMQLPPSNDFSLLLKRIDDFVQQPCGEDMNLRRMQKLISMLRENVINKHAHKDAPLVAKHLLTDLNLLQNSTTRQGSDDSISQKIYNFSQKLFQAFDIDTTSGSSLFKVVVPMSQFARDQSDSDAVYVALTLCDIVEPLRDIVPDYVIAAFQSLALAIVSLIKYFSNNKDKNKRLIRSVRLRFIDFLHVLAGHLIETSDQPDYTYDIYDETAWRPFANLIPFTGNEEGAEKFPTLISLVNGEVNWYLPRFPADPQSGSQSREKRVHDFLENDRAYKKAQQLSKVSALQQPHKRANFADIVSQVRNQKRKPAKSQGNKRTKQAKKKQSATDNAKWSGLFGTKQELQLMIQRFVASEFRNLEDDDCVDESIDDILCDLLTRILSISSIDSVQHPLLKLAQVSESISKDITAQIQDQKDLASITGTLKELLPSVVNVFNSLLGRRQFQRDKAVLTGPEIVQSTIVLQDFLNLRTERNESDAQENQDPSGKPYADNWRLTTELTIEQCKSILEKNVKEQNPHNRWSAIWSKAVRTGAEHSLCLATQSETKVDTQLLKDILQHLQESEKKQPDLRNELVDTILMLFSHGQQNKETEEAQVDRQYTSKSKAIKKLVAAWNTTKTSNVATPVIKLKSRTSKSKNSLLLDFERQIMKLSGGADRGPVQTSIGLGPLFTQQLLDVNLKRGHNLDKYFQEEIPKLRAAFSELSIMKDANTAATNRAKLEYINYFAQLRQVFDESLAKLVNIAGKESELLRQLHKEPNDELLDQWRTLNQHLAQTRFKKEEIQLFDDKNTNLPDFSLSTEEQEIYFAVLRTEAVNTEEKIEDLENNYITSRIVADCAAAIHEAILLATAEAKPTAVLRDFLILLLMSKSYMGTGIDLAIDLCERMLVFYPDLAKQLQVTILHIICLKICLQNKDSSEKELPFENWPTIAECLKTASKHATDINPQLLETSLRFFTYLADQVEVLSTEIQFLMIPILLIDTFRSVRATLLRNLVDELSDTTTDYSYTTWRSIASHVDCFLDKKAQLIVIYIVSKKLQSARVPLDVLYAITKSFEQQKSSLYSNAAVLEYFETELSLVTDDRKYNEPSVILAVNELHNLLVIAKLCMDTIYILCERPNELFSLSDGFKLLHRTVIRIKSLAIAQLGATNKKVWSAIRTVSSSTSATNDKLTPTEFDLRLHTVATYLSLYYKRDTLLENSLELLRACIQMGDIDFAITVDQLESFDKTVEFSIQELDLLLCTGSNIPHNAIMIQKFRSDIVFNEAATQKLKSASLLSNDSIQLNKFSIDKYAIVGPMVESYISSELINFGELYAELKQEIEDAPQVTLSSISSRSLLSKVKELILLVNSGSQEPELRLQSVKKLIALKHYLNTKKPYALLSYFFIDQLVGQEANLFLSMGYNFNQLEHTVQSLFEKAIVTCEDTRAKNLANAISNIADTPFSRAVLFSITFAKPLDTLTSLSRLQPADYLDNYSDLYYLISAINVSDTQEDDLFQLRITLELPRVAKLLNTPLTLVQQSTVDLAIMEIDHLLATYSDSSQVNMEHLEQERTVLNFLLKQDPIEDKIDQNELLIQTLKSLHVIRKLEIEFTELTDEHAKFLARCKIGREYAKYDKLVKYLRMDDLIAGKLSDSDVETIVHRLHTIIKILNCFQFVSSYPDKLVQIQTAIRAMSREVASGIRLQCINDDSITPCKSTSVWNTLQVTSPEFQMLTKNDRLSKYFIYLSAHKRCTDLSRSRHHWIKDDEDYPLMNYLYQHSQVARFILPYDMRNTSLDIYDQIELIRMYPTVVSSVLQFVTNVTENYSLKSAGNPKESSQTILMLVYIFYKVLHVCETQKNMNAFSVLNSLPDVRQFIDSNATFSKVYIEILSIIEEEKRFPAICELVRTFGASVSLVKEQEQPRATVDLQPIFEILDCEFELKTKPYLHLQSVQKHLKHYEKEKQFNSHLVQLLESLFNVSRPQLQKYIRCCLRRNNHAAAASQPVYSILKRIVAMKYTLSTSLGILDNKMILDNVICYETIQPFSDQILELYSWIITVARDSNMDRQSSINQLSTLSKSYLLHAAQHLLPDKEKDKIDEESSSPGENQKTSSSSHLYELIRALREVKNKSDIHGELLYELVNLCCPKLAKAIGLFLTKRGALYAIQDLLENTYNDYRTYASLRESLQINHHVDYAQVDHLLLHSYGSMFSNNLLAFPFISELRKKTVFKWMAYVNFSLSKLYQKHKKLLTHLDILEYSNSKQDLKTCIREELLRDESKLEQICEKWYQNSAIDLIEYEGHITITEFANRLDYILHMKERVKEYLSMQQAPSSTNLEQFLHLVDNHRDAALKLVMNKTQLRTEYVPPSILLADEENAKIFSRIDIVPTDIAKETMQILSQVASDATDQQASQSSVESTAILIAITRSVVSKIPDEFYPVMHFISHLCNGSLKVDGFRGAYLRLTILDEYTRSHFVTESERVNLLRTLLIVIIQTCVTIDADEQKQFINVLQKLKAIFYNQILNLLGKKGLSENDDLYNIYRSTIGISGVLSLELFNCLIRFVGAYLTLSTLLNTDIVRCVFELVLFISGVIYASSDRPSQLVLNAEIFKHVKRSSNEHLNRCISLLLCKGKQWPDVAESESLPVLLHELTLSQVPCNLYISEICTVLLSYSEEEDVDLQELQHILAVIEYVLHNEKGNSHRQQVNSILLRLYAKLKQQKQQISVLPFATITSIQQIVKMVNQLRST